MELLREQTVRVKANYANLIKEHTEKIYSLFCVRISEETPTDDFKLSPYVFFKVEKDTNHPADQSVIDYVQDYVDKVCWSGGGEDSSYDSEECGEGEVEQHRAVCRTGSDTLAAEYADYVDAGYSARLDFALKLGYTENHLQAALHKLGPQPANNELLAELIKLGGQSVGGDGSSDWGENEEVEPIEVETRLRPIVVDGSNVAMSHGNKEVFSCWGIKLCVDWFKARGHTEITVFVPKWRKEVSTLNNPITHQEILYELERERILVWTPSRLVAGRRLICYDDRYVLRLAAATGGIVVSNDNYRDLAQESPEFRRVVEHRILMYSFVNDRFMPPDDPLGRSGPTLDKFLMFGWKKTEAPCPYGRKCTYGSKCKFYHPERGVLPLKTVSERLVEHAQRHRPDNQGRRLVKGKSLSLPLSGETERNVKKVPLCRTKSHVVTSYGKGEDEPSCSSDKPPAPPPAAASAADNLHRKLERQLSLNPWAQSRSEAPMHQHQPASRIASAPAGQAAAHIHPQSPHHARLMIHYHLASIFPEHQVLAAMKMYPNETNPQKICAAILALFPIKP